MKNKKSIKKSKKFAILVGGLLLVVVTFVAVIVISNKSDYPTKQEAQTQVTLALAGLDPGSKAIIVSVDDYCQKVPIKFNFGKVPEECGVRGEKYWLVPRNDAASVDSLVVDLHTLGYLPDKYLAGEETPSDFIRKPDDVKNLGKTFLYYKDGDRLKQIVQFVVQWAPNGAETPTSLVNYINPNDTANYLMYVQYRVVTSYSD